MKLAADARSPSTIESSQSPARIASPAPAPRSDARATVALAKSPLQTASNAASLSPQRSRHIASPTDQASIDKIPIGTKKRIHIWKKITSTVWGRVSNPKLHPSAAARAQISIIRIPSPAIRSEICTPRCTPISPWW